MYKKSQFIKDVYKPKDVMEVLNVTHRTLYNYDELEQNGYDLILWIFLKNVKDVVNHYLAKK